MSLFGKAEYKQVELPFCYIKDEEDYMAGGISIEAFQYNHFLKTNKHIQVRLNY